MSGYDELPARPDHRRLGRARLRGGRLRRGDHRRRKRPGPRQPDRPADGGPLGMSPAIGPVTVLPRPAGNRPTARTASPRPPGSWSTPRPRRIIEGCYQQALATLRGSRNRLDRLAHTLLQRETLDEDEAYAAADISRDTAPAAVARGGHSSHRAWLRAPPPVRKKSSGRTDGVCWPTPDWTRRGHGHPAACSASGQQGLAGGHERGHQRLEQSLSVAPRSVWQATKAPSTTASANRASWSGSADRRRTRWRSASAADRAHARVPGGRQPVSLPHPRRGAARRRRAGPWTAMLPLSEPPSASALTLVTRAACGAARTSSPRGRPSSSPIRKARTMRPRLPGPFVP